MFSLSTTPLLHYDSQRKRLWVGGQRVHHGLTGALLFTAGTALMLHDWKDRSLWFRVGRDTQP